MDRHRVHLLPLIKSVAAHENMAPSSKGTGYDPFKVKMVGSTPPGAIQFIGSESLTIG